MTFRSLVILLLAFTSAQSESATISNYIGGGLNDCYPTLPCAARDADISDIQTIGGDPNGNIYVGSMSGGVQITPEGALTTLGAEHGGLGGVQGFAVSPAGVLYVSSSTKHLIYKRIANGTFVTIAGTGTPAYNGDGIQASQASLNCPSGLAFDSNGNLFVADRCNYRIRKIDTNGVISTYVGNGNLGETADNSARTFPISWVADLAIDHNDVLHFSEPLAFRVRKINAQDKAVTVAGTTAITPVGFVGDNGPAVNAKILYPRGITFTAANELLIAEQGSSNGHRIRKVDLNGIITTISGTGVAGSSGNGGEANLAALSSPTGLFQLGENLYVGSNSFNGGVRRIGPLYLPGPPQIVKAHINVDIMVFFNAGLTDGGATITGYNVYADPTGGTDIHAGNLGLAKYNCSGPYCIKGYAHVVTELLPETNYRFRVTAINSVGEGPPSEWSNAVIPPLPELSLGSSSVNEGHVGNTSLGFPITLSKPAHKELTVNFIADEVTWTQGVTVAQPGFDYIPVNTNIVIPKGASSVFAYVPIIGDTVPERDEYLVAQLSNPVDATISIFKPNASGYILDDEGIPLLSVNDYGVGEGSSGAKVINFSITLSNPAGVNGVSVDINAGYLRTTNESSATPNVDYAASPQHLVFLPGEEWKSYSVKIIGDRQPEPNEVFGVFATNTIGAYLVRPNGLGRIFDDDAQNLVGSNGSQSNPKPFKPNRRLCNLLSDQIILFERSVASKKMGETSGIKLILETESKRSALKCAK